MDIDALKAELRGRLGDLSEAQLPDTQLDRALGAALREFSRFVKRDTPCILPITTNVYDYALPVGTTDVTDIFAFPTWLFWSNVDPLMLSVQLPTLSTLGLMTLIGIKPIENWPLDWQIIPPDPTATPPVTTPTLRFLSLPDVPAIVFYRAQRPLGAADLSDEEQQKLLTYAEGSCLVWLGMRRAKPVKRVPTAAGNLLLDDGRDLRKEGRELMKEFASAMGQGATVLDRG